MADAHANFAYSTVAAAPSPAVSGLSLDVAGGTGALFPTPPFNATVWPSGVQPLATNAEIVRVTAVVTDTLTVTRAQESSTARTVLVGDQIAATVTKKTLTDLETGSLPAQWTVDDATGRFVLTYVTPSGLANNVPVLQITQTGVPLDYTPMFWIGDDDRGLTGTQVFGIDSSGDADWEFRDSAVSLIFHRMHDGDDSQLVKIGESNFSIQNTPHHTDMLLADYDGNYLQLGASTSTLAFFATGGATKQTGVAVTAAGIHAALVAYGLIAA